MAASKTGVLPWVVIRHVELEQIGTIAAVLERAGIYYRYLDVFRGVPVPESLSGLGGLIVMGGPMGVYDADRYPFLTREMNLIRQARESQLPVIGICLGAQLIAAALGARVYPGAQKEIGWYPVQVVAPGEDLACDLPSPFMAFHWHGDTFDLPSGAVRLFRSELYENQGFRYRDNIYAFQFHFEVSAAMIADWLLDKGCQREIAAVAGLSAETIRNQTGEYAAGLERLSERIFTRILATVTTGE